MMVRFHGSGSYHSVAPQLVPWAPMQDAVHWAGTKEAALSGKARGWLQDVLRQRTLSAVDGARDIGIGVGAEQVQT